mmetsp:Transcript_24826/g.40188  ORF Transcript_24826/g.40188 Transcript_24826/m.40188 type:complete len:1222 (+) Transcript_24826:1-3666(+)
MLLGRNQCDFPPVLVLSYKNHALDTLLLSLINDPDIGLENVARVGSGGKLEDQRLETCNLRKLQYSTGKTSSAEFQEFITHRNEANRLSMELVKEIQKLKLAENVSVELFVKCTTKEQLIHFVAKEGRGLSAFILAFEDCSTFGENLWANLIEETNRSLLQSLKALFQQWKNDLKSYQSSTATATVEFAQLFKNPSIGSRSVQDRGAFLFQVREGDAAELEQERGNNNIRGWSTNDECFGWFPRQAFTDKFSTNLRPDELQTLICCDPWELTAAGKALLSQLWQRLFLAKSDWKSALDQYIIAQQKLQNAKNKWKACILRSKRFIFMTISGALTNYDIVSSLEPKVVLLEEAAELLEPHLISVLPSTVEHLISIGDHKQLRPGVECYELTKEKAFDISLFERLVNNGAPHVCLQFQGRMRPEFAQLLLCRYPEYKNNAAVIEKYQPPQCVSKSMFFLDHAMLEDGFIGSTCIEGGSKRNTGEATLVLNLALWFVLNEHPGNTITVLCPYLGQSHLMADLISVLVSKHSNLQPQLKNIHICTVDQYQGDENEIVLLSLTRGNAQGNIGFLKSPNRLCVALSRAHSGLYVIGNSGTIVNGEKPGPMWQNTIQHFKDTGCFGNKISLCCPRHPTSELSFGPSTDTSVFETGFCDHPCNFIKECNHICPRRCHPLVSEYHDSKRCTEMVIETLPCGHKIEKLCNFPAEKVKCKASCAKLLKCGHTKTIACHQSSQENLRCEFPCTINLSCGHPCPGTCGERPCEKFLMSCTSCLELAQIREEEQREIARRTRASGRRVAAEKLTLLKKQVAELKASPSSVHALKYNRRIIAGDPEFDEVRRFVEFSASQPSDRDFILSVQRVEKVINLQLEELQLKAVQRMYDPKCAGQLAVYTPENGAALEKILARGFTVRKTDGRSSSLFGTGVHLASSVCGALQWHKHRNGSSAKFLLCRGHFGNVKTVTSAGLSGEPIGDLQHRKQQEYDSIVLLQGGQSFQDSIPFDRVVYEKHLVLPLYIVEVERVGRNLDGLSKFFSISSMPSRTQEVSINESRLTQVPQSSLDYTVNYLLYFFRNQSSNLTIHKIQLLGRNDKVVSKYIEKKKELEAAKADTTEHFAFHGTAEENLEKIVKDGFKVGGRDGVGVANGTAHGFGVYTASSPDISKDYARGCTAMLLLKTLPGNSSPTSWAGGHQLPATCHSYSPGPSIRIYFDSAQILPMAIVYFKQR